MNQASTGPGPHDADRDAQIIADAQQGAFDPTYGSTGTEFAANGPGGRSLGLNPGEQSVKHTQSTQQSSGSATQPLGETSVRSASSQSLGVVSDADAKTTTFSLEADAQTGLQQSRQTKLGSGTLNLEAGVAAGQRMRYTLTLPGADQSLDAATQVNPLQPESLPVGARAVLDSQAFAQREVKAELQQVAMQSKITEASGRSYLIERVDERHVRVATGPNDAIEAANAIGLKAGPAQALVGRTDRLGSSRVQSAQFDLADPRAVDAMTAFARTGEVAPGTPGVDQIQTLERIGFSSQQRMQLQLGPLDADLGGARNEGSQIRISEPGQDGYAVVQQLKYGDNVPLTVLRHYDGNNVERVQERSYRFEIDGDVAAPGLMQRLGGRNEASEEKAMAQSLNSAISGDMAGTGAIQAGQKTTLVFNEQQMQALLQQTQTAATANKIGASPLALLVGNGQASDTEQFAIAMARNVGGQPAAFAERLQRIADGADGQFDGRLQRIDADVAPRPAAATAAVPDPRDPAHPDHGLLQQCTAAVGRLEGAHGPTPGMDSERLALGSLVAAREHGLQRVDHVLLGNDPARGFVVQGALDSPAHLRGSFDAKAAQEAPVEASLQRLQALGPAPERDAAALEQATQQESMRQSQAR
ncbi:XVIPCD domain-containing protein [Xanthomonas campestris]|uniref:XVIPCD domain-containing protein n=1 Tax=Xanthomonas campestris TaxID=339 RepID=UPI00137B8C38|nr:XVIPCD domain-containing protein [Xanthomonas campestris]